VKGEGEEEVMGGGEQTAMKRTKEIKTTINHVQRETVSVGRLVPSDCQFRKSETTVVKSG
jgi:hypothetical protein